MTKTTAALRVLLVVAALTMTGCSGSGGTQAAPVVTGSGEPVEVAAATTSTASPANATSLSPSPSALPATPSPSSLSPAAPAPTPAAPSTTPAALTTVDWPAENGPYSGSGPGAVRLRTPPGEASVLTFACPACSGQVQVMSDGYPPSLIGKDGPYTGEILLKPTDNGTITLTVTADSDWTAAIVALADHPVAPLVTSGLGDAVVVIADDASTVTLEHQDEGDFSVVIYNADGTSLTINETGPSSDTVGFQTPAIFSVNADGNWSITASRGA